MAVKPRTLNEAKATYNTNGELAWWVFMRMSGLALIFLTFGHLFMNNWLVDAGAIDYAYVTERFSKTWIKIYDSFLLGLAILHGGNGVRYSLEDYIAKPSGRFFAKAALYAVVVFVMAYGIISLWAIDYLN